MHTARNVREGHLTGSRVYTQIADRIRERILTGLYAAGASMPSEAALSAEFRVARNTMRRALRTLEADGLIVTAPSKGRIVKPDGQEVIAVYRYQVIAGDLRRQIERGDLAPGDSVPSVAELRWLYDTSRNTVRQALGELEREGLIMSRPGKRRFVGSPE
jgi:DNA-binding GntR family transcriptional regulator